MSKVYDAHLLQTKDVILEHTSIFEDTSESNIDEKNHVIKNVAIASTRQSQNGYIYSDRAFNTLTQKAEGVKVFVNHPSRQVVKDSDGVRSMYDWAGVFHDIKREGDKITGDLYALKSAFPLFKEIVRLQPGGMGMSINSRVKVHVDENGKESIHDIDKLHSVDLVSSASLTKSLWESVDEKALEEEQKDLENKVKEDNKEKQENRIFKWLQMVMNYHSSEIERRLKESTLSKSKQEEVAQGAVNKLFGATKLVMNIVDCEEDCADKEEQIQTIFDDLDDEIQDYIENEKEKTLEPVVKIDDELTVILDEEETGDDKTEANEMIPMDKINDLIEAYAESLPGEDELLEEVGDTKNQGKPGGSSAGTYKASEGPFCGPSGGAPSGTFPVGTRKRAIAALAYARHAPNPEGVRKCVCRNWSGLPACKK